MATNLSFSLAAEAEAGLRRALPVVRLRQPDAGVHLVAAHLVRQQRQQCESAHRDRAVRPARARSFDVEGRYLPMMGTSIGVGYNWLDEQRNHRAYEGVAENTVRVDVRHGQ
jgi:hypothetical protein